MRRSGPGTAGAPALSRGGRTRGRASSQLPAAGSGGRGSGEGVAEGLSQPRKRRDSEDFLVRVRSDMAAKPPSPGGPVCTEKEEGLDRP